MSPEMTQHLPPCLGLKAHPGQCGVHTCWLSMLPPFCPLGIHWTGVKGQRVFSVCFNGVEISLLSDVCLRQARDASVTSIMQTTQLQHQKSARLKLLSQPQGAFPLSGKQVYLFKILSTLTPITKCFQKSQSITELFGLFAPFLKQIFVAMETWMTLALDKTHWSSLQNGITLGHFSWLSAAVADIHPAAK